MNREEVIQEFELGVKLYEASKPIPSDRLLAMGWRFARDMTREKKLRIDAAIEAFVEKESSRTGEVIAKALKATCRIWTGKRGRTKKIIRTVSLVQQGIGYIAYNGKTIKVERRNAGTNAEVWFQVLDK